MAEAVISQPVSKTGVSKKIRRTSEELQVLFALSELVKRINTNECLYDTLEDDDLIDANIYERKSLEMKYRFYLNEAKNLGLTHKELTEVKHGFYSKITFKQ